METITLLGVWGSGAQSQPPQPSDNGYSPRYLRVFFCGGCYIRGCIIRGRGE